MSEGGTLGVYVRVGGGLFWVGYGSEYCVSVDRGCGWACVKA